ncbi:MAG: hypothetical protein DDT25_00600 [Chloroflexi bacterium]|nr:hypothetical protein [Chloroflexota bacterium]
MITNASLAVFGGRTFADAMRKAAKGVDDPCLGRLAVEHVQICPQNLGQMTEQLAIDLMDAYPYTKFRLHANVRVLPERKVINLDAFDGRDPYWQALSRINSRLGAHGYTAHAGRRDSGKSLAEIFESTKRAADLFNCRVGVEGGYPTPKGDPWILSTWRDYQAMLESGVDYALDLSHIKIVATLSRQREDGLVREMLASERCMEVHLSDNCGRADEHRMCEVRPWWWQFLGNIHPSAVVFSEGAPPKLRQAH